VLGSGGRIIFGVRPEQMKMASGDGPELRMMVGGHELEPPKRLVYTSRTESEKREKGVGNKDLILAHIFCII
jgi:uncharacterized protein YndB with AHSA1/START domain